MTAQPIGHNRVLPKPARTPSAIRAVLAANADLEILAAYDLALDTAYTTARESSSLEPLRQVIDRWWFEAENWCDPAKHRAFLAMVEDQVRNGPPPPERRVPREQAIASWEAAHPGQKLRA